MKIYEMPVVEIPTNRPMVRADHNDQIYKTKDGKWKAVVDEIDRAPRDGPADPRRHDLGRGLGDALRASSSAHGIEHEVLNAKPEYAEREGETDRPGGPPRRGHDRHQHGRPRRRHQARRRPRAAGRGRAAQARASRPSDESYEAELAEHDAAASRSRCKAEGDQVRELGGLFICGTERHESRRIDNQLRGRSGRQGDPGESRFFLSAEDDLIRLFAGDRIYKILDRLGPVDDDGEEYPLEAKMLTQARSRTRRRRSRSRTS